jgi:putative flippase GtrA
LRIRAKRENALPPGGVRFTRFLATSGTSAVANLIARWLLSFVVVYQVAVALAYLVGIVTAFVLARIFVFHGASGEIHHQFGRFLLVNAVGFCQVWIISVGLDRIVFPAVGFQFHIETLAHLIGLGSLAGTSYFLHKRFSFRPAASLRAWRAGPACRRPLPRRDLRLDAVPSRLGEVDAVEDGGVGSQCDADDITSRT